MGSNKDKLNPNSYRGRNQSRSRSESRLRSDVRGKGLSERYGARIEYSREEAERSSIKRAQAVSRPKTVVRPSAATKPQGSGLSAVMDRIAGALAGFWARKKLRNAIITAVVVLAVLGIGGSLVIDRVLGKIDFMDKDQLAVPENVGEIVLDDVEVVSDADTITDEQVEEMDKEISAAVVGEDGLISQEGVTNVLILGIDTRQNHNISKTRSDVMIILSINENTKEIVMSSLMRDIYVRIPGRKYPEKLTHAHAYGGPALAKETIEGAFGVKIDHFVMVNFYAFMDVVDALGGIELDISESERKIMNRYVAQINRLNGMNEDDGKLWDSGDNILLTGKQALGYVRNRYSGNGDYERTQRQREVLGKIIEKAKTASAGQLLDLVDAATGNMATDYTKMEIIGLAAEAINYKDYEIKQTRIPVEGTFTTGIKNGVWRMDINFKKNRDALYKAIFGEWYTGDQTQ